MSDTLSENYSKLNKRYQEIKNQLADLEAKLAESEEQLKEELKEQLAEKEKEMAKLRELRAIKDDASQCVVVNGVKFSYEQILIIQDMNYNYDMKIKNLNQQLKSQSAEIVEKIRNLAEKDFDFDICTCCGEDVHDDVVLTKNDFNKILDKVLKEYQK